MNKLGTGLALITLAASLIGCAVPDRQDVMNKWAGRNIAAATAELGPPHRTVPMPNGETMYVWEQQLGVQQQTLCRTGLQVDASGTIVNASQVSNSLLCR